MKEKRKNRMRRRFPWWSLLVAGFALGVILTLLFTRSPQTMSQNHAVLPPLAVDDPLLLTATAIVKDATATAIPVLDHGSSLTTVQANQGAIDPLALTATRIVEQATVQVAGS
ncbi:MAG: hypothetical protein DIU68_002035 [Chloroflexota bacterium]|nr:MAG: hypothetical protein DIU68_18825 [Chloroflexota bacterium]